VELPYLNRARLAYTSAAYVSSGAVPGVQEANKKEPLLPWGRYHQVGWGWGWVGVFWGGFWGFKCAC